MEGSQQSVNIWEGSNSFRVTLFSLIISLLTTDSFKCFDILSEATLNIVFVSHIYSTELFEIKQTAMQRCT